MGNVELRGRYLAGFDPDVVEPRPGDGRAGPAGQGTGLARSGSSAARNRKPATTRHLPTPLLRPDGTLDRPLSVCRVAFEYELPRLPRSRRTPGVRASWNSPAWTGLSDPPYDAARHVGGAQPQPPGWSRLPCTPVPPDPKSVIN